MALGLYALRFFLRPSPVQKATQAKPSKTDADQACAVLGLHMESLDAASVIETHKRLMQRVHPDKGGSVVLAQQLNEAKRVLLIHLQST